MDKKNTRKIAPEVLDKFEDVETKAKDQRRKPMR